MCLARLQSDASGGSQSTVCQGLRPPKGQRVGKRTEVPLGMPQNEKGHGDREGTLSSRDTVDTAVHVWTKGQKCERVWMAGAGCHQ